MFANRSTRRNFLTLLAGAAGGSLLCGPLAAQPPALTRGFDQTSPAYASGEELNRQRNIWVMEVQYKPMRMVFLPRTNADGSAAAPDQVWYLAWRAINRPLTNRKVDDETVPVNDVEPRPGPDIFIPDFTLVSFADRTTEIPVDVYHDVVIPAAVRRVNVLERRSTSDPLFLDSVSLIRDLPPEVSSDEADQPWVYGVAMWRNPNPDIDFFKVIMRGFSNGYEIDDGPDGQPLKSRKVLVQKFTRLGDRFDPDQKEFAFDGNPTWEYQPMSGPLSRESGDRPVGRR
ncbi:MAG: twin-arginine translocation signal domain-containing protein [Planctomyces sp.]|nr:twin-arginine translocation signal domain-containing protein [Planctomyces sp.]